MQQILTIAWKELYTTYTDRNLLLIIIVTPLVLATIIGLAFSGFFNGSNDVPVQNIPVVIVNQDEGMELMGGTVSNGQVFVDLLIPADESASEDENVLFQLTDAIEMTDPTEARAAVDRGDYAAAILIPADFTRKLAYAPNHTEIEPTTIEVYASPALPVSANIIRSIVESISSQLETGNITVAVTIGYLVERIPDDMLLGLRMLFGFSPDFAPAFDPDEIPLQIEQQTVSGEAATFNPLAYFGAANAVLFMMFSAQAGAMSMLEERRDGTLQRLLVSPTRRMYILLGKMIGTFCSAVFQMFLLFIFLTLIGSFISGQLQFIWGTNLPLIVVTMLASALAASGLGAIVMALVRTPEQGHVIGGAIVIAMGVLGGAFFNVDAVDALRPLSRLTINYWATNAFTALSANQTDIGLNLLFLLALGAAMFFVGVAIFNRRLNV